MSESEQLKKIIREELEDAFQIDRIEDVHVVRICDVDGDDILRIYVGLGGKQFNAKLATGVTSRLRYRLLDEQEEAFPVMSYVSPADLTEVMHAAKRSAGNR